MDLKELKASFSNLEPVNSTANELQIVGSKIAWKGHIGSSAAICASAVATQSPGNHLFILNDKEQVITASLFFVGIPLYLTSKNNCYLLR